MTPEDLAKMAAAVKAVPSPSERRRAQRGDKVIQAGTQTNRKARRAQRTIPTLDWNCDACKAPLCRIVRPRNALEKKRAEELVARAFRQHCRLTGCVSLSAVEPVVIPDELVGR